MTSFVLSQTSRGLTAMALLYLTIMLNFWIQSERTPIEDLTQTSIFSSHWDFEWHSHSYTTVKSMLVSLFSHADWEHVMSNMFLLWMMGKKLFVPFDFETSREARNWRWLVSSWSSPFCFLWIYFGSQLISVAGCRLLSHLLDREWERRKRQDRATWSWQWVPDSWKDAYYTVSNAQQAVELRVWQYTPTIGSSAAVFGVVGAYIYSVFCNRQHPARMDSQSLMLWLAKIAMELSRTPFSLDQLSLLNNVDNIDHAAHICGFVGGFSLAAVWHTLSRIWRNTERHFHSAQEV
jgi:membrane associated rhomboid family serine protease